MKMKATGIIRRIDDLGRVVIPREIRRSMGIREGDALEIFVDPHENTVCFKKYSPLGEVGSMLDSVEFHAEYIESTGAQREAENLVRKLRKIFEENS
jgi:AbrB family transcriptional regulator (stage V sporulation protein T)